MGTTRTNTRSQEKGSSEVRILTFDGQRSRDDLARLMDHARRSAIDSRAAYLKAHPEYIPCSVAGCLGLVSPAFQRKAPDGTAWGLCPRSAAHALLVPELFGQTTPTA